MAGAAYRERSRRLAWLAVAGAVGLVVAYVALVRTATGQRLDGTALEHRFAVGEDAASDMAWLLDAISARSVLACSAALVLVAVLRRRLVLAVGAVVALAGSAVIARALKDHLLTRTDLGGFGGVSYNTFPSGHATVAIALALVLVLVAPTRLAPVAAGVAAFAASTVGTAVVVTGGHRPSDAVGAYLATVAWCSACAAGVAWLEHPGPTPTGSPAAGRRPLPLAVAVGLAVAGLLVLLVRSVDGPARRAGLGVGPYALGVLGLDVVAVGVVAAFAVVQHGRPSARPAHLRDEHSLAGQG